MAGSSRAPRPVWPHRCGADPRLHSRHSGQSCCRQTGNGFVAFFVGCSIWNAYVGWHGNCAFNLEQSLLDSNTYFLRWLCFVGLPISPATLAAALAVLKIGLALGRRLILWLRAGPLFGWRLVLGLQVNPSMAAGQVFRCYCLILGFLFLIPQFNGLRRKSIFLLQKKLTSAACAATIIRVSQVILLPRTYSMGHPCVCLYVHCFYRIWNFGNVFETGIGQNIPWVLTGVTVEQCFSFASLHHFCLIRRLSQENIFFYFCNFDFWI